MKLHTRLVTALAASTLCALTLVASPALATSSEAASTAGWLAHDLSNGSFDNGFGGSDYGLALDAYFAFEYAHVFKPEQGEIIRATGDGLKSYITGNAFGDDGESDTESTYAGATAKALVAAQTAGKNATSFGRVDLVKRLESVTGSNGQIKDDSDFGDYANVLGQSYAVQGLTTADSPEDDKARDFLLDQQCGSGSFRLAFSGTCKPDTDATATAVSALVYARSQGLSGVDTSIKKAVGWLMKEQSSDGSFGGGDPLTSKANSNSTGLAAKALGMTGEREAAAKAGRWVAGVQVRKTTGGKLRSEVGAIALNPDEFDAAKKSGISSATRSTWRRASAQAIYGLFYLAQGTVVDREAVRIIRPKPIVRTVTGATVVAPAATGNAAEATTPTGKLGQYLSGQLTNGDHVEVKKGGDTFVDYDLTARSVLSLRQLGQQSSLANRTTKFLFDKESIAAYAHGAPYEKKALYAGPLAKLIIAGSVAKKTDQKVLKSLADELSELQQADGSFKDKGKYADRIGDPQRQVLATLALRMAGDGAAADKAVGFIEKSQCDDGGFGTSFGVVCTTSDPAATGWALQALGAVDAADLPASSMLADLPTGWDADRVTTVESAARSLRSDVHVDGSVDGADGSPSIPATAAVAAGRQTAGFDTRPAARFVAAQQRKNGGLGGKKGDLDVSLEAAPAIGASSLMAMAKSNLSGGISFPLAPASKADAKTPAGLKKTSNDFSISRPAAYAGGGALGVLILASLGIGVAGLSRKRGPA